MASIQEIEVTDKKAHLNIDGAEYLMLAGTSWVTIIAGRWVNDRRSIGKTFHRMNDLTGNYKRHGSILAEYASRVCPTLAS